MSSAAQPIPARVAVELGRVDLVGARMDDKVVNLSWRLGHTAGLEFRPFEQPRNSTIGAPFNSKKSLTDPRVDGLGRSLCAEHEACGLKVCQPFSEPVAQPGLSGTDRGALTTSRRCGVLKSARSAALSANVPIVMPLLVAAARLRDALKSQDKTVSQNAEGNPLRQYRAKFTISFPEPVSTACGTSTGAARYFDFSDMADRPVNSANSWAIPMPPQRRAGSKEHHGPHDPLFFAGDRNNRRPADTTWEGCRLKVFGWENRPSVMRPFPQTDLAGIETYATVSAIDSTPCHSISRRSRTGGKNVLLRQTGNRRMISSTPADKTTAAEDTITAKYGSVVVLISK